jgi:hypothetical protein
MPHLVRWSDELKDFGLLIVAPHAQRATNDEIKAKAESLGLNFPVVKTGGVSGADFRSIPHCFLFGHDGKLLYEGHPKEAEARLRVAVGKGLVEKAGLEKATPAVTSLLDSLKKGQSPVAVLQKAQPLQRSSDAATAGQAKKLVAALTEGGQRRLEEAMSLAERDPVAAYDSLTKATTLYKGTPVAEKANQQLTRLKSDRAVMAELKARPSLETIKKLDTALKPRAENADPKGLEFQKAYAAPLKQMRTTLSQMKRNWPDAKATKEAAEIAERYGVSAR